MTRYDVAAIFVIILIISYRIYKRNSEENTFDLGKNKVCVNFGIVALFFGVLCSLSIPFVVMTTQRLVNAASGDSYVADVISVRSYEDEDDEGRRTTMYVPTISFIPTTSSKPIIHELDIASGEEYKVGDSHKVAYNPETGNVQSKELSTILLLIAGLIFSLVLFSFVLYGILYAFYVKMPVSIWELLIFNFIGIIVPLAIIGMNSGLIYYLYQRLVHGVKDDQPVWVIFVCVFFSLVLTLVTFGFFKLMINKQLFSTVNFSGKGSANNSKFSHRK